MHIYIYTYKDIYIYIYTYMYSIYIDNFKEKGGHIITYITLLSHYYIYISIYMNVIM